MTLPTSHQWLVRALNAYAQGKIGWSLAYACTDHAARELASDGMRQAALDAWGLMTDAHTIRTHLGRGLGPERKFRTLRTGEAIAAIRMGGDPEQVEIEESYGQTSLKVKTSP
jgi:hypothetical protein